MHGLADSAPIEKTLPKELGILMPSVTRHAASNARLDSSREPFAYHDVPRIFTLCQLVGGPEIRRRTGCGRRLSFGNLPPFAVAVELPLARGGLDPVFPVSMFI